MPKKAIHPDAVSRKTVREGFGNRLRALREYYEEHEPLQHGQQQWAKMFEVSDSMYNRWENGGLFPDAEYLVKMMDLTKVSANYLIRGVLDELLSNGLREYLRRRNPELLDVAQYRDLRGKMHQLLERRAMRKLPGQRKRRSSS